MEKLIAFNLYVRTPSGSYHTAVIGDDAKDVYLACVVDELIAELYVSINQVCDRRDELAQQLAMANDAAAKGEKARTEAAGMQERIEELENGMSFYAEARDFHMWDRDNNYVDNGNAVARELMESVTK